MFVDYHVRCDYSDDSWYLMEEVIKDAIEMGIDEICFIDHVDDGVKGLTPSIKILKLYYLL